MNKENPGPPSAARFLALSVLNRMEKDGILLDPLLESLAKTKKDLNKQDLRLIYALTYGVIRWKRRIDHLMTHFTRKPMNRLHPTVLNILRLGLFQIFFMDKIPISAAVNTSVDLARDSGVPWAAGFVNGLLRNASRHPEKRESPASMNDPASAMGVDKSFPDWLIRRWIDRYGREAAARRCDHLNTQAPLTIRTNTLRISRKDLADRLAQEGIHAVPTPLSPEGLMLDRPTASLEDLPSFQDGLFQVQDEAAQLIGILAGPRPGDRVLDACAGLGGKTGHLAILMKNRGHITALDHNPKKLKSLEMEMRRLGITIVTPRVWDLHQPISEERPGLFDRILLDAPCSGLGVIRRNPDAKWGIRKENLGHFQDRQIRFLSHAASCVRSGGLLTYAVCSAEPEETCQAADSFLSAHPDFSRIRASDILPDACHHLVSPEGFLVTDGLTEPLMDHFFSACFQKNDPKETRP